MTANQLRYKLCKKCKKEMTRRINMLIRLWRKHDKEMERQLPKLIDKKIKEMMKNERML